MEISSAGDFVGVQNSRPIALFLRTQQDETLDGILGWLVRRFGLDTFSTSLLKHRGQLEMKAAALVLLVVFLFDLGAWTLLFNTILQAELLKPGVWTPFAFLAGALFAGMVVLYERQFLTVDLSPGWRKLAWPTLIRFLVIFGSALITAQPIELLFFRQAVLARTHEEGIRQHVATQREYLDKLEALLVEQKQALADLPTTLQQQDEHVRLAQVETDLDKAQRKKADFETKLTEATRKANYFSAQEPMLRKSRDAAWYSWQAIRQGSGDSTPTAQEAKRAHERADKTYTDNSRARQAWLDRVSQYKTELGLTEADVRNLVGDREVRRQEYLRRRSELEQRIAEGTRELRAEKERVQRWVRRLRELTPDQLTVPVKETLSELSGESTFFGERVAFTYQLPRYHFFEQLRVVSDLSEGCPPKWAGVSTKEEDKIAEEFSLSDSKSCNKAKGAVYRYSYRAIYAIALVIPLMVFATKLLMAAELKTYYSAAAQAEAGNPDALLFKTIQRALGAAAEH